MRLQSAASTLFASALIALVTAALPAAASQRASGSNPDLPPFAQENEGDYLQLRDQYDARLRGIEPGRFANPLWRTRAVQGQERQERSLEAQNAPSAAVAWTEIGPDSVSNGQALDGTYVPVSGRVTAIAIDPTNSNKVYLGTAQGGVWRSLDGGAHWTAIFDTAQSLSIGALAVAPSSPSTVYVGTGEANLGLDSFFGVGLYRIDNADTTANLVGPINPSKTYSCNPTVCTGTFTTTAFGGRSISRILVSPTDANTIFVSTTIGGSGLGSNGLTDGNPPNNPLGLLGVYRSTNATAAAGSITFQKLAVTTGNSADSPATGNRSVTDMAFVNSDPHILLAGVSGANAANDGGIFLSTTALDATPTFAQTLQAQIGRITFGVAGNTVLAATSESSASGGGVLRESTGGVAPWTILHAADGFCGLQCDYDIAVGIDPRSVAPNLRIYLGGDARGTSDDGMKLSNDGGATFARDDAGLHADTHTIVFDASSNPSTVWTGNDGGVWKRQADYPAGTGWTNLNNGLGTLQFQSIAVGKADPFFTFGGTQDNGTEWQASSPGWSHADDGDGGYALIDQSTTSVYATTYHTYFNRSNVVVGFARTFSPPFCAYPGGWEFRGYGPGTLHTTCDGSVSPAGNGIDGSNPVEFYAPMALGAGTPNTVYFGTDRLYRSTDSGDNMFLVSQAPLDPGAGPAGRVTAVGVSSHNDNVRIVGLQDGKVFATTAGVNPLTNITSAAFPANPADPSGANRWVGRAVIDPNNPNTAYVTFSFYAPAGQGIWKITNLSQALSGSQPANWTAAAGTGLDVIPSIPVDAFVVDPNDSTHLYAGTDIGVYESLDSGIHWHPFGTGLPKVAVFDIAVVRPGTPNEVLRIATHGRSMWEAPLPPPIKRAVADFNGDAATDLSVYRPSEGRWYAVGSPFTAWGTSTDIPVPGNYRGGSPTDFAVYRPSEGRWYVNGGAYTNWGAPNSNDIPVPGNYEGGATTDPAVYRPSEGRWYIKGLDGIQVIDWGTSGDIPVPGDYDGNGITDVAVFRPSEGRWYIRFSTGSSLFLNWGVSTDIPVPGDYDGNGSTDIAIYRPSEGRWYVNAGAFTTWGSTGDIPEPGDYNGDGKTDLAVFRPSEGRWYVMGGAFTNWGISTDKTLPLPYAIRRVFFP